MEPAVLAAIISTTFTGFITLIKMHQDKQKDERDKLFQQQMLDISQKFENERTKIQIDANIVWKARVEWIEKVRNLTSEFITEVNSYLLTTDKEIRDKKMDKINEIGELLILYFGPDKQNITEINILNKKSNESKNEKIVELIKQICDGVSVYFFNEATKLDYLNNIRICEECKHSADIYQSCEYFEKDKLSDEELNRKCENHININTKWAEDYMNKNAELKKNISLLTEVMRIYLKIEWNRTKERSYM